MGYWQKEWGTRLKAQRKKSEPQNRRILNNECHPFPHSFISAFQSFHFRIPAGA
jgi:hypothetical protein